MPILLLKQLSWPERKYYYKQTMAMLSQANVKTTDAKADYWIGGLEKRLNEFLASKKPKKRMQRAYLVKMVSQLPPITSIN